MPHILRILGRQPDVAVDRDLIGRVDDGNEQSPLHEAVARTHQEIAGEIGADRAIGLQIQQAVAAGEQNDRTARLDGRRQGEILHGHARPHLDFDHRWRARNQLATGRWCGGERQDQHERDGCHSYEHRSPASVTVLDLTSWPQRTQ
jgi:hypothetical protein